jgi:hypothetical protein
VGGWADPRLRANSGTAALAVGTPLPAPRHEGLHDREAFVAARLAIVNDPKASAADRLKAMEQLENRALGRAKETVEHAGPSELDRILAMSPEEREALRAELAERRARLKLVKTD